VNGRLVARQRLSAAERAAMWDLLDGHFLGVTRAVFERDLEAKDHAILLTGAGGALRGFTTLAAVPVRFEDEALTAVYSGDTIVDHGARGSFALAATWIGSIRRLRGELGGERMVWLLICSSPRTYRFLPLFFRDYHPRAGGEAPPRRRRLIDALARQRYAGAYDPASGIVRLDHPQPLRPELRPSAAGRGDEHDRCFFALNPGWRDGDELVCFTELDDANLTAAGRRMARAGERAESAGADRRPAALEEARR
jgi:hypothetical protein